MTMHLFLSSFDLSQCQKIHSVNNARLGHKQFAEETPNHNSFNLLLIIQDWNGFQYIALYLYYNFTVFLHFASQTFWEQGFNIGKSNVIVNIVT